MRLLNYKLQLHLYFFEEICNGTLVSTLTLEDLLQRAKPEQIPYCLPITIPMKYCIFPCNGTLQAGTTTTSSLMLKAYLQMCSIYITNMTVLWISWGRKATDVQFLQRHSLISLCHPTPCGCVQVKPHCGIPLVRRCQNLTSLL